MSYSLENFIFSGLFPIVGVFIQPLIGFLNDIFPLKSVKRTSFMIFGTFLLCISMPMTGFSDRIGCFLGDTQLDLINSSTSLNDESDNTFGLIIGIAASVISLLAYSFVQIPSRALIGDVVPIEDQSSANFIASMMSGIGGISFFLLAATFTSYEYYYETMFLLSVGIMIITCLISVIAANLPKSESSLSLSSKPLINGNKFHQLPQNDEDENDGVESNKDSKNWLCSILHAFNLKVILVMVLIVFGMMAFGGIGTNICNYYAKNMYHASSNDPEYDVGVSMGLYAMAIQSLSQIFFSSMSPFFFVGQENVMFITSFIFSTLSFFGFVAVDYVAQSYTSPPTLLIIASFIMMFGTGMLGCCLYSIPFMLIRKLTNPKRVGTVISVSVSFTQLAVSLDGFIFSGLIKLFGSLVVVMWFSGIISLIGTIGSIFILIYVNKK
ncbi:hypothetical protein QTN25_003355 [Entamoeba marina]